MKVNNVDLIFYFVKNVVVNEKETFNNTSFDPSKPEQKISYDENTKDEVLHKAGNL